MAVDGLNGVRVGNTNMIRGNPNDWAQPLMGLVDHLVSFTASTGREQPEVAELRAKRSWDTSQRPKGEQVWEHKVAHDGDEYRLGRSLDPVG